MTLSDAIRALRLIESYSQPGDNPTITAEHDEIWVGHSIPPDRMNRLDVAELERLGFSWEEGVGWNAHVSG